MYDHIIFVVVEWGFILILALSYDSVSRCCSEFDGSDVLCEPFVAVVADCDL